MKQVLTLIMGLLAVTTAMQAKNFVITNDTFWKTTTGSYIYSQGGGIFRFPDSKGVEHYYWYGAKYQEAVDYCPKALAGSKSNMIGTPNTGTSRRRASSILCLMPATLRKIVLW